MKHAAVCVVAAAFAMPATAQVSEINDPFIGEQFETFELIGTPGSVPGPVSIFNGTATLADELAGNVIAAINLTSLITNEVIFPWNGNFMGGLPTGWGVIEFDQGAYDFGGYIGTADNVSGGNVSFFDANDQLIETVSLELPLNQWEWYGWHSDEAFHRVVIHGGANPGAPIVLDDLQVNFVPAPGASAVLVLGALTMTRRRRS